MSARVLLVEDDADHADLIGGALGDAGHEVRHVRSAAEAQAVLDRGEADVVLLDYTLGGESSFGVLDHARAAATLVPVVVLTGRDSEELVVEAMRLGAADFLVKSFDRSFLRVLPLYVSKNLERSRLARALSASESARMRSERYRRLVLDSLDATVVGVDELFRVTDANRAWPVLAATLGLRAGAADPSGRRLDDLLGPGPLTDVLNEFRTALALGEADVLRGEVTCGALELEVEATPLVAADRGEGVVFVLSDVTERNRARRDEVALSSRLADANEELDRLVKARGALVSAVSRELRSPAQSIGGFARMLAGGALGELSERAARGAEVVGRGAERLARLADDLDYLGHRPAAGEGTLRPVDPVSVMESALSVGAEDRKARKVRVLREWPGDLPPVRADKERLTALLATLVADVVDEAGPRSSIGARIRAADGGRRVEFQLDAEGARGGAAATDLATEVARETARRHGGRLDVLDPASAGRQGRGGWRLVLPGAATEAAS